MPAKPRAKFETAFHSVYMIPLDIFNKTLGRLPAVSVATTTGTFEEMSRQFPISGHRTR